MRARWPGAVGVTGLDLADRVSRDDFLKWKHLGLAGMQVSVDGDKYAANLGDITLDDFYGRILLSSEGRLNVMDLVAEPGQAGGRSEERRVGKEWGSKCRSRWSPEH